MINTRLLRVLHSPADPISHSYRLSHFQVSFLTCYLIFHFPHHLLMRDSPACCKVDLGLIEHGIDFLLRIRPQQLLFFLLRIVRQFSCQPIHIVQRECPIKVIAQVL